MFDKRNRRNGVGGRENVCHEKWKIRSILCGYKFNSHATGHHPESREREKMNKKNGFHIKDGKYLHQT